MQHRVPYRWSLVALVALVAGLLVATPEAAQTASGQARVVQATVAASGITATLSDTGTLGDAGDAREASQGIASVPSLLSGEALHAAAIGWSDQAASEASMANLDLAVGSATVGAAFVMSRARAAQGTRAAGSVQVDDLTINGLPIAVTGAPNQTVDIPGGLIVINEQKKSPGGMTVNALHIFVDNVADVVIASATAALH